MTIESSRTKSHWRDEALSLLMKHAAFDNQHDKVAELKVATDEIRTLLEEADKIPAWQLLSRKKQMAGFIRNVLSKEDLDKITGKIE